MWSGYMQMLHSSLSHSGRISDIFLPMIDLSSSDPTWSKPLTMPFITTLLQLWPATNSFSGLSTWSLRHNQETIVYTIWIIFIPGGFHTKMSIPGFIDSIMPIRGDVPGIYTEGSVEHNFVWEGCKVSSIGELCFEQLSYSTHTAWCPITACFQLRYIKLQWSGRWYFLPFCFFAIMILRSCSLLYADLSSYGYTGKLALFGFFLESDCSTNTPKKKNYVSLSSW